MELFHFRRTALLALALAVGVLLAAVAAFRPGMLLAAVVVGLLALAAVYCASLRGCSGRRALLLMLLLVAAAGVGALRMSVEQARYDRTPERLTGAVTARVVEVRAGSVVVDKLTVDGEALSGKAVWRTEQALREGDRVQAQGTLNKVPLRRLGAFQAENWARGISFSLSVQGEAERIAGRAPPFAAVRGYLRTRLEPVLGDAYGAGLGLLLGDTGALEERDYENFRNQGILHIFAVSGLHFSVLYGVLNALCARARLGRWKVLPLFAVLFCYAGVCRFSPSVLRALTMIGVSLAARALGLRYDLLSGLGAAVLVVALIQPFQLLTAGFVLSVCGVLSIALLSPPLGRLLRFLPRGLRSILVTSLAAQIGLLPVISYFFGVVYTLSALLNVLIAPFVSAAFVLLFVCSVLILPIPGLGFLFAAPRALLEVLLAVSRLAEETPASLRSTVGLGALVFGLALTAALSDCVNLRRWGRAAACLFLSVVLVGAGALADGLTGDRVLATSAGVVIQQDGATLLVDYGTEKADNLAGYLARRGIRRIDVYLPLRPETFLSRAVVLAEGVHLGTAVLADDYSAERAAQLGYYARRCGERGLLVAPAAAQSMGNFVLEWRAAGALLVGTEEFLLGVYRTQSDYECIRNGALAYLSPGSAAAMATERLLAPGREELRFVVKSGIINEIPY